jgi:hypothetical protein
MALIGTRSLAIGFQATVPNETSVAYVKVQLCANGQAVSLVNKTFSAFVRFVTASGSPPLSSVGQGNLIKLYTGPVIGFEDGDFSVDSTTGGGPTPGSWYGVSRDLSGLGSAIDAVTHVGFRFLVNGPWRGTIYVDYVQIF